MRARARGFRLFIVRACGIFLVAVVFLLTCFSFLSFFRQKGKKMSEREREGKYIFHFLVRWAKVGGHHDGSLYGMCRWKYRPRKGETEPRERARKRGMDTPR